MYLLRAKYVLGITGNNVYIFFILCSFKTIELEYESSHTYMCNYMNNYSGFLSDTEMYFSLEIHRGKLI